MIAAPARNFQARSSRRLYAAIAVILALVCGTLIEAQVAAAEQRFDVLIKGGTVVDGSGGRPRIADVGIRGQRIAAVGRLDAVQADATIDARGLTVTPGFINSMSWSTTSLIEDGRAQSDLRQGVTLEIMSEGHSPGPLTKEMKARGVKVLGAREPRITWTSLGEYLDYLERSGTSVNFASYVGASTVREYVIGLEDRAATPAELQRMQSLVAAAMEEGAIGVSSALIYTPGSYASTDELVALTEVAAQYGGTYASHMRSEGNRLLEAVEEFLTILERANIRGEIYHLKAAGRRNWPKIEQAIARVERARAAGIQAFANMYTFSAGGTGLAACIPRWIQEGEPKSWTSKLTDPAIRARLIAEMQQDSDEWENLLRLAGPEGVTLMGFNNPALLPYRGRTLADVARERGRSPEETVLDLVAEDGDFIWSIYHFISEENIRRQATLPWISFGSDAEALAPEGDFLQTLPHPRAYGTFAKVIGEFVRERKLMPIEDAVRRLSALPAQIHRINDRGLLEPGYFADIAVFDATRVASRATFENPHQYAAGMVHVFVNGTQVLKNGEHTGAKPGRAIRGPSWRARPNEQQR
jgi:N-acyl-D-amino-acid deacylase